MSDKDKKAKKLKLTLEIEELERQIDPISLCSSANADPETVAEHLADTEETED